MGQDISRTEYIKINPSDSSPVYQQIVRQVRMAVVSGRLRSGDRLPTVRDLASQLGVNAGTVARAYLQLEGDAVIATRRGGGSFIAHSPDDALLRSEREGRLQSIISQAVYQALSLGFMADDVQAAVELQLSRWSRGRGERSVHTSDGEPVGVGLSFAGSHDLAIELLLSHVRRELVPTPLNISYVGSLAGLIALERGEALLAGSHLLDEATGEYNLPFISKILTGQDFQVVTVAERQQGLIVARGNPCGIRGLNDLAVARLRYVNRQRGSGTRVLLDFELKRQAIDPAAILGYDREEPTHTAVATAIADGDADAGLGVLAAARALGLDFIPVRTERYDLVYRESDAGSPVVSMALAVLRSPEFKQVVNQLGGYDVTLTGSSPTPGTASTHSDATV